MIGSGMVKTVVKGPKDIEPLADYGFFGPDSVSWKVWGYPTSVLLGFSRAVTIEELDPLLVASVTYSGQVRQRTPLRFDRTLQYFATVIFGDAESVLKSSDILMKIHARSYGIDDVTGQQFDANDPDSQLWIHLTAWHSILYTYEMFGPGKLSEVDEARYWEECAIAAQFQTCDPDRVPRTRDGVRQYFEDYRPDLVASQIAQEMFHYLANLYLFVLPDNVPTPIRTTINAFTERAVIATLPGWMREMGGIPQSRATDVAVVATLKPAIKAISLSSRLLVSVLDAISPRTMPILAPYFFKIAPTNPRVFTVAQAREEFGYPRTPREIQAEYVAQRAKGKGPKPYAKHHREAFVEFETAGAPA